MEINNNQNLINQKEIKTEIVEKTKNENKPILQYLERQNKPLKQPVNQIFKENNNFNEINTTNNNENVNYNLNSYKKYNKSLFKKVMQNLNIKTLTENNSILKNMLTKLEKLKKKHDKNILNFEILEKEKKLLEDIFNYCFSKEALEFFKLAEKLKLKEKLNNKSCKFINNINKKLKELINFYKENKTFSLEIVYEPEQKFNKNNLKEKTNNNNLCIKEINSIIRQNNKDLKEWQDGKKENPNKIVFEEELSKKEALKKALVVALNEYAQNLKNLNCEIYNNKEEMEKYIDCSISDTFCEFLSLLNKFDTFYKFDDSFKLDVKNSMFATRAAINDSINILKTKEKKILKINNNILSFLAEKAKSSSDEFKFKKLHEIIKKIKEKQTYLNEVNNFIKVLFKRNENENDLEKSSEIEILSLKELKDVLSYLEKNFKNFKETSKDSKYKEEEDKFLDDYLKTYYILIKKLYAITLLIKDIENIENDYSQHYVKLKKKNLKKLINFFLDFYFKINSIIENKIKEKNSLIKNYKNLNVKYLI